MNATEPEKIPLLGDIPYLGNIFRYTTEKKDSLVRVFLIQPKEITNPLGLSAENIAKKVSPVIFFFTAS
ncbi:hypothetical protein [Arsenophonus sp.]|uniref:hypothetical protein n=1 Tax=unclassified Arsenophonus TaxID=2627083 RepID=UPI0038D4FCCE